MKAWARLFPRLDDNASMRILLVEDDPRMLALVRRGLTEHGHVVDTAATGPEALDAAAGGSHDVIVLDVMLPGLDGVQVVARLRGDGNTTPVLMLTARDGAADIVQALDAGADDHLTKPFAFSVLLARLRALGRRGTTGQTAVLSVADLSLDTASRHVTRAGTVLRLTRTEYHLLECLLRHAGRVVTRDAIVERIWGADREIENNTLDAFIKSLRHKVDGEGQTRLIHTIRGVGYSVRAESE
jgi:DNA-binding response OmpR family regulator